MKTVVFRITEIKDPYFGRTISRNGDEIARVFNYFAHNREYESIHKEQFTYCDWYGSETKVLCHISSIVVDSHGNCYIEVTCSHDIPSHYMPSPCDVIGKKYYGSYHQSEKISGEIVKRYM